MLLVKKLVALVAILVAILFAIFAVLGAVDTLFSTKWTLKSAQRTNNFLALAAKIGVTVMWLIVNFLRWIGGLFHRKAKGTPTVIKL